MIYFILFGAEVLKGFFARAGLPAALAGWAATSGLDPWLVLIAMLVIFIVLGLLHGIAVHDPGRRAVLLAGAGRAQRRRLGDRRDGRPSA